MEQSVPKRRHINFRRREFTQKKAYNMFKHIKNLYLSKIQFFSKTAVRISHIELPPLIL